MIFPSDSYAHVEDSLLPPRGIRFNLRLNTDLVRPFGPFSIVSFAASAILILCGLPIASRRLWYVGIMALTGALAAYVLVVVVKRIMRKVAARPIEVSQLIEFLDYDLLYQKLLQSVDNSPYASILAMLGGPKALDPLKGSFQKKMKEALTDYTREPSFQAALKRAILSEAYAVVLGGRKRLDRLILWSAVSGALIGFYLGW